MQKYTIIKKKLFNLIENKLKRGHILLLIDLDLKKNTQIHRKPNLNYYYLSNL